MTMKYNHVMRTSCLAALICLSLSAVSLANGPVTDSAKASTGFQRACRVQSNSQ